MKDHSQEVRDHPGAVEASSGIVDDHPEIVDDPHGVVENHLDLWRAVKFYHKKVRISSRNLDANFRFMQHFLCFCKILVW